MCSLIFVCCAGETLWMSDSESLIDGDRLRQRPVSVSVPPLIRDPCDPRSRSAWPAAGSSAAAAAPAAAAALSDSPISGSPIRSGTGPLPQQPPVTVSAGSAARRLSVSAAPFCCPCGQRRCAVRGEAGSLTDTVTATVTVTAAAAQWAAHSSQSAAAARQMKANQSMSRLSRAVRLATPTGRDGCQRAGGSH